MIPELKSIHNVTGRPKIRFYEGQEGLIEVYEDTLTSHEPIRAYAAIDEMVDKLDRQITKHKEKTGSHR